MFNDAQLLFSWDQKFTSMYRGHECHIHLGLLITSLNKFFYQSGMITLHPFMIRLGKELLIKWWGVYGYISMITLTL